MGLQQELAERVATIIKTGWKPRDGLVVPEPEDIALDGDAVKLDAVVLYADIVGSSNLVANYPVWFSTDIYKTFLYCAARIVRACGGEITAYDGDRIMGVFLGDTKNTCAGFCALKINHAVKKIINPLLTARYKDETFYKGKEYLIKHVVGVDSSIVHAAKTGIRGDNDLVWVGTAANYAAKLSALRYKEYSSFLSKAVYDRLMAEPKKRKEQDVWTELTSYGKTIYGSNWTWEVDYAIPT